MLRRVVVKGYKSFSDAEVRLEDVNVVMGPNGSGKSNLFDLLRFVSRLVNGTLADAFSAQRGDPIETIKKSTGKVGRSGFRLEIDVELSRDVVDDVEEKIRMQRKDARKKENLRRVVEKRLRYTVEIELDEKEGTMWIVEESLRAMKTKGNGWTPKQRSAFIETTKEGISLRREGQPARPRLYEPLLDLSVMCVEPLHIPFYPHITAFKEELRRWRFYYFEPSVMREECPIPAVEQKGIKENGAELASFFWTLQKNHPQDFRAAVAQVRSIVPAVDDLRIEQTPQNRLLLSIKQYGEWFTARVISEGTLRVLGLIAILHSLERPTLVGYEEPENGVHPRRISIVSEMLKNAPNYGFQFIINTHSPLFARHFSDRNLLICRYRNGSTEFESFSPAGELYREAEIDKAFEEDAILRGDYGG